MLYSKLVSKTSKTVHHDADSVNAKYLLQAGFVRQEMAGVYAWLPLGLRVLRKVEAIVREEMNKLGSQEILLPALQAKEHWDQTGRWDSVDVLFKLESQTGKTYGLGPTHEEVVTPLIKEFIRSYKDLPVSVYQIQTKFRDELRAKSGVLRGREFGMKDLYSFHANEEDFDTFYARVLEAYLVVYARCGVQAKVVEASGGSFSKKYSHEFQVLTQAGEDLILTSETGTFAQNSEIATLKEGDKNPENGETLTFQKGVEVGNIFDLGTRFSDAFDVSFTSETGEKIIAKMGCYGIGTTRLVGTIVEALHDDRGMMWPMSVAPYHVQVVSLPNKDADAQERVWQASRELYDTLVSEGIEVLWDDRVETMAGEKFADADLIGLPIRIVISDKTLQQGSVEWKLRSSQESTLVSMDEAVEAIRLAVQEA